MKDLEKMSLLISQRERYFASIQSTYDLAKKSKGVLDATDTPTDSTFVDLFVARMSSIERTRECFERCILSIEEVNIKIEEKDRVDTIQVSKSFEELYFYCVSVLNLINKSLTNTSNHELNNSTTVASRGSQLKLPRIQIPNFDGTKPEEWSSFYSLFNSLVHHENAYSPCEKFHYLRSLLKGEPLERIAALETSDANYYIAWDDLVRKYQNIRVLAAYYVDAMLNFQPFSQSNIENLSRFIKVFKTNVAALKTLKIDHLDDLLLLHIASRNLDRATRKAFEGEYSHKEIPSHNDLMNFIEDQQKVLELTKNSQNTYKPQSDSPKARGAFVSTVSNSSHQPYQCLCCHDPSHRLYQCDKFRSLPVADRQQFIRSNNLCPNCTGNHNLYSCKSQNRCKFCKRPHHQLLHQFNDNSPLGGPSTRSRVELDTASAIENSTSTVGTVSSLQSARPIHSNGHEILLSTAIISILDKGGNPQSVRVLIDQGSQVNIITKQCANRLGLPIRRSSHNMTVIGGVVSSQGVVSCTIRPADSCDPSFNTYAVVVPKISDCQPQGPLDSQIRLQLRNLKLADPNFDKPAQIDFLLGAELFASIMDRSYNVIQGEPSAMSTCFGWILVGKVASYHPSKTSHSYFTSCCQSLDTTLKKFWEAEAVSSTKVVNPEDVACEEIFVRDHYRLASGRYVVQLPFKSRPPTLPNCRELALKRFTALENRLFRQPELRQTYNEFMLEYCSLEHMAPAAEPSPYVIPHHIVLKHDSVTTKLRTVFDASFRPYSADVSLNSELMNGPKLQRDLCDILCGFRLFEYVVCADIKMMYRQILIDPADRKYQHIFYRSSSKESVSEYELNTVTYGMKSSSFLAQRVLLQLVADEGVNYPAASNSISQQCYVDDIVTGAHTLPDALALRQELVQLLRLGGFELRKWYSNRPEILEGIPDEHQNHPLSFYPLEDNSLKVLGVLYDASRDVFTYAVKPQPIRVSKRGVLSEISKIFDPLGWLTPVTFFAKCLMQKLWQRGLHWDENLPEDLATLWNAFIKSLPSLCSLTIHRHIPIETSSLTKIFGFCDGSEKGYAAVIYATTFSQGKSISHLVKAKSKVAPLQTMSIPRLELSGAVLLAKMLASLKDFILQINVSSINLYSDSTIVLSWLRTPPHLLKIFVANRVVEILQHTAPNQWNHVKSAENPADPASRGLLADELIGCSIWWNGPGFIHREVLVDSNDHILDSHPEYLQELKTSQPAVHHIVEDTEVYLKLLDRISSFSKSRRIFAYIMRFIHNRFCERTERLIGPLSSKELRLGLLAMIRVTQKHFYHKDFMMINKSKPAISNELRSLAAFVDDKGVLRVGGRIDKAPLPYDTRHPFIIPHKSRLGFLICAYYHDITIHGTTRLMASLIQRQFWIPSIRKLIRKCIFSCKTCYLPKALTKTPIMAELPSSRFENLRPFSNIALDFAGPYFIKSSSRRNAPKTKCYLAVFVCMEIKAIHLELSPDLSSEGFLRVLDRLVARRGICRKIYCDRGTNFIGAARHLQEVYDLLLAAQDSIFEHLADRQIEWHFSPAAAPHFNGMAEAGVKSAKSHLTKALGQQILTYEELYTIIVKVEAVLNSRPLGAVTSDAKDNDYLTPGHFLVGAPLVSVPEEDFTGIIPGRLSRFQMLQQCLQSFWKRWTSEYIPTLIPRSKWTTAQENLAVGDVVYILKENTPPLQWPLGRVLEVFPSKDGTVRVARIQTRLGCYIRPVHKLVPLPQLD